MPEFLIKQNMETGRFEVLVLRHNGTFDILSHHKTRKEACNALEAIKREHWHSYYND
jgi:hypothetical protein